MRKVWLFISRFKFERVPQMRKEHYPILEKFGNLLLYEEKEGR